jgi:DNA-binding NarL/FixJ family response regulator
MKIKIIIVEDDNQIRKSLVEFLSEYEEIQVIADFGDAESLINKVIDLPAFDIAIMDLGLPGMSGVECISKLKIQYPNVLFLVFSVYDNEDKVFDALCAGATGYILKSSSVDRIVDALVDIYHGGAPMSAGIARKVVQSFQQKAPVQNQYNLSARENEILALLSKGFRYKEIGAQLFISTETVRTHVRNIYEKLQVQSRTEALNKFYGR